MRRSTGAILRETRPETIITSAWRGLARNTSDPKRARSLRDDVAFIISIAQHARPNVAGHNDDLRAQLISESRRVVSTSGKASAMIFSRPILLLHAAVRVCRNFRFSISDISRAWPSASQRAPELQSTAPF